MAQRLVDVDPASVHLLMSISELGSISKAASRHGLSQPSASRRVRDLERRLGVRLLERTATGAELSADGARLVQHCQSLVVAGQELIDAAGSVRAGERQALNIAATPLTVRYTLPRLCALLGSDLQDVDIEISVADTLESSNGVRDGRFDLALVDGPKAPIGVSHRLIGRHELVLAVGAGHPWWRRRKPVGIDQLTAGPLWLPPRGSGSRDVIDVAINRAGSGRPPASAGAVDTDQRLSLIALGVYPGVVRAEAAAPLVSEGVLRVVPTELLFEQPIRLIWTGRGPSAPATLRFVNGVTAQAPGA
jgi:molybdate transport repressor ModE-like protein